MEKRQFLLIKLQNVTTSKLIFSLVKKTMVEKISDPQNAQEQAQPCKQLERRNQQDENGSVWKMWKQIRLKQWLAFGKKCCIYRSKINFQKLVFGFQPNKKTPQNPEFRQYLPNHHMQVALVSGCMRTLFPFGSRVTLNTSAKIPCSSLQSSWLQKPSS